MQLNKLSHDSKYPCYQWQIRGSVLSGLLQSTLLSHSPSHPLPKLREPIWTSSGTSATKGNLILTKLHRK